MLTGFTWCVPLKTKTAEEVSKAYLDHIYSNFGGSVKYDRQWDRVQKQTLQGSHQETRHRIFHPFTTIQTTKQWKDRGIPQVPKGVHQQAHQPRIGME